MFTGLIETTGQVIANTPGELANRLIINAGLSGLTVGESIAVNGVCLTLLPDLSRGLAFDVSPETLNVTGLGDLGEGDCVNLERAMLATSRFGGHYVNGHVDKTAVIESITPHDDYVEMIIGGFASCDNIYLLPKGSITLDGVSLTINQVRDNSIAVMLIPHTLAMTTLGQRQPGDRMNVEFDYLTQIIAHQLRVLKHD